MRERKQSEWTSIPLAHRVSTEALVVSGAEVVPVGGTFLSGTFGPLTYVVAVDASSNWWVYPQDNVTGALLGCGVQLRQTGQHPTAQIYQVGSTGWILVQSPTGSVLARQNVDQSDPLSGLLGGLMGQGGSPFGL